MIFYTLYETEIHCNLTTTKREIVEKIDDTLFHMVGTYGSDEQAIAYLNSLPESALSRIVPETGSMFVKAFRLDRTIQDDEYFSEEPILWTVGQYPL